jgi:hypothetical protein
MPGCPRTPVNGSASWCGSVSIQRHAPEVPLDAGEGGTQPSTAPTASRPSGGHCRQGRCPSKSENPGPGISPVPYSSPPSDTQSGGTSPFLEHRLNTRTARLMPAASPRR